MAQLWLFRHQVQLTLAPGACGGQFTENRDVGGPMPSTLCGGKASADVELWCVVRISDVEITLIDIAYEEVGGGIKLSMPWGAG